MIRRFKNKKEIEFDLVLEFIKANLDEDFYLTSDNQRVYINTKKALKQLLRETAVAYVAEDQSDTDYKGFAVLWKSKGGNVTRYYVKIVAKEEQTVKDFLTIFSWNHEVELYVKVHKNSKFLDTYKRQGFKFKGGRGKQVLLQRDKPYIKKRVYRGDE